MWSCAVRLPRLDHPEDYAGLFLYDFGDHVSVGYTAEEIHILRTAPEHAGGTAYYIYRVDDAGRFELKGMADEPLRHKEGLIFAYQERSRARADYDRLRAAAEARPVAFAAELCLAELHSEKPSVALGLVYAAHASQRVSAWVSQSGFGGGDSVSGGARALVEFEGSGRVILDRCELRCDPRFAPRPQADVLADVLKPVQR